MSLFSFLSRVFQWKREHEKDNTTPDPTAAGRQLRGLRGERAFLLFIDSSAEAQTAVRYTANRVRQEKGRIILLKVITEEHGEERMFVGSLLESEAERHAENQLKEAAQDVYNISGNISQLVVKKGDIQTEILSVLRDNPDITVLVTGPPAGGGTVLDLVRSINNPRNTYLPVPVTIIPKLLRTEESGADTS